VIWTVLSAVIVFILLSLISDLDSLKTALIDFPLGLLVPIGLLSLGNYFLRYVKWHWYLKLLGYRINRYPNFLIFLSGFALTVTPGKVGEFIKTYIVKERFKVPYTASTAVLLMERFTDVAAIVLLSCLGLFLRFLHWWIALISILSLFAFLMLLRNRVFAGWVIDQTARFRLLKRFSEHLRTFYDEGWILLEMGVFIQSLILSLAAWFLEGLGYALVAWGLGSGISLMEGVFIYSVALLGGALTLFVGGLGATEGGMVGLGVVFGMSRSTSTASTIIIRVMTLWFAVLIGWGVFLFTPGLRSLLSAARTDEIELTSEEIEVKSEDRV
jgi:uncharacterized protein (TIRG00374 family)